MPRGHDYTSNPREWLLTLGVFLIFGQIGVFVAMLQDEPPGWLLFLILWASAGLIAVGWAIALNRGRWWLLLLVPLLIIPWTVFPFVFGWMYDAGLVRAGYEWPPIARKILISVSGTVSLSLGFSCIIYYVSRTERFAAAAEAELRVAGRMHEEVVPDLARDTGDPLVFARSTPSSQMGGDLVDLVEGRRHSDALLADVSGHGVGAGVIMAMLKSALRTRLRAGGDLGAVVADLNRVVYELTPPGAFITAVWVRVPRQPGIEPWQIVLAGHHPALVHRAATGRLEAIENDSLPLGVTPDEAFPVRRVEIAPGDTLLAYTDGLTEVFAADRTQLGAAAIDACFREHAARPLAEIDAALRARAAAHGRQRDDQSVLLLRRPAHPSEGPDA